MKIVNRESLNVFLLALLVIAARLIFFFVVVPYNPEAMPRDSHLIIARNLVAHQGYTLYQMPTSFRSPGASCFFATVLWLWGDHALSIAFANWILDALTAVLLYFIALEVFQSRPVAWMSMLLFAFYVPEMYYSWQAITEPLFGLFLAAFVFSFLRSLHSPSVKHFVVAGVMLGAASLTRSIMLYYLPVAIGIMVWLLGGRCKCVLKYAGALLISFLIVLSPWVVRNYVVFNEFIPGDRNTGITAYHGNHALGEPDFLKYRPSVESSELLQKVIRVQLGDAYEEDLNLSYYDDLAMEKTLDIIKQYPGRYLILSLVRFFKMWYFIEGEHSWASLVILPVHIMLLALAAVAFFRYLGDWWREGIFLVSLVLFINGLSAVVRVNVRYIIPVVPYVLLFAAFTLERISFRRLFGDRITAIIGKIHRL